MGRRRRATNEQALLSLWPGKINRDRSRGDDSSEYEPRCAAFAQFVFRPDAEFFELLRIHCDDQSKFRPTSTEKVSSAVIPTTPRESGEAQVSGAVCGADVHDEATEEQTGAQTLSTSLDSCGWRRNCVAATSGRRGRARESTAATPRA